MTQHKKCGTVYCDAIAKRWVKVYDLTTEEKWGGWVRPATLKRSIGGTAVARIHTDRSAKIPVCMFHYENPIPEDFYLVDHAGKEKAVGRIVKLGKII